MATTAYLEDVLSLTAGLRRSELGPRVLEITPAFSDADAVTIDLRVHADELRPAIAVQQALQLSVDAAALYLDATEGGSLDPDYAAGFLAERPVEVFVVQLGTGSFLARFSIKSFSINPKTKAGRNRLLAIGGLTTGALVLTGVLAPVAVSVAVGLGHLNNIFTPDAKPPEVPLKTIDAAEAQRAPIEAEISATAGEGLPDDAAPFTYDISFASSPYAIAEFLAWVKELDGFQAYGHFKSEPGEANRIRIWLSGPLDIDMARAIAEGMGIEVLQIEAIDAA